jgi:cobalt-zinc-cadmium efflux system outer membrane protein
MAATPAFSQQDAEAAEHGGHDHSDDAIPFQHDHTTLEESIAGAGPTLNETIEWAEQHAPLVQIAEGQISIAQARREGASLRVPENPVFGLAVGGRSTGGATQPEFGVSIQQPVWINGSRSERLTVAEAAEELAAANTEVVRWQVHVEAHRLYLRAQLARRRLVRARALLEHADAHREIAERKVEVGEAAPPLMLIANSNYARAQALLLEAQRTEEAARIDLAGWIGWDEAQVPPLPVDAPQLLALPDSSELLQRMADAHPSLEARRAAVHAAEAEQQLARADRVPIPSVGASYNYENEGDQPSHVWRVTATIPLPVARRNQEQRARAIAERELEQTRLEATSRQLRTRMLSTIASIERYRAEVELYADSVLPQLNENLSLLLRSFRAGEIDIHEVAAVHEQALESVEEYLNALANYYDATAELEGLVGAEIWEDTTETTE